MFAKLGERLREIYSSHGGWEWAALMIGLIISTRGALVVIFGTAALHPTFPSAAEKTLIDVQTRSWFLLFNGVIMIISVLYRWRRVIRPAAMASTFLCVLVGVSYWLIPSPFRLYIQGATYLILSMASALVYSAAGDARARGW